jgi:predicted adenylyl cyclase CyaB
MRNIELKARLRDPEKARLTCHMLGAVYEGDLHQRDTYFHVREGRLKLRESDPGEDYLVYYRRNNSPNARQSDYVTENVDRSARQTMCDAFGMLSVVEKNRRLFLWHNVRIHLDQVEDLGDFIEFEAVLGEEYDEADGHGKIKELSEAFGITDGDLVADSYLDMALLQGTQVA